MYVYCTPGCGRSEVRLSFAAAEDKLEKAMALLAAALQAYPGTHRA